MKTLIIVFILVTSNLAFAGTSKKIKPEHLAEVKKIAVVTHLITEEFKLMDKNGLRSKYYGGGIAGGILSAMAANNFFKSLGGDPDSLRRLVKGLPYLQLFNDNFCRDFEIGFDLMSPGQVEELNIVFPPYHRGKGIVPNNARKDYRVLKDSAQVDLVLEIKFVHGLVGYGGGLKPTAAVSAEYTLVETKNNKLLVLNHLTSDSYYREPNSVDEFIAAGPSMYQTEIVQAIKGLQHLIASEFGKQISDKEGSYWNSKSD